MSAIWPLAIVDYHMQSEADNHIHLVAVQRPGVKADLYGQGSSLHQAI